jgi:V-type H+-transporting ATPase subunit a
MKDLDK